MREEERREAAWFRISTRVLSEAVSSLKHSVPFVSNFYIIEFSKSTCTFKRLAVQRYVQHSGHLYSLYRMFRPAKTACILSALEPRFSCIESAVGLHSETSGLPGLAGL